MHEIIHLGDRRELFVDHYLIDRLERAALRLHEPTPGYLRVELQTAAGAPIPGYTLAECPEIVGDAIAYTVTWKHGPDVSPLAGQPLRLRVAMKDADLYALRFRTGKGRV